ncbi:DUF3883 domain-containing protein [Kaistella daneshvariae]|uniref:DUF3883 domain-containing protein n=1 Tax=Kaistella daneshvariae TaxID=2487074 RepID=UPI001C83509E|nr:DUF3883 domain-containing protein [Kaistella daneshvariae]
MNELHLIHELSNRDYVNNSMAYNSSLREREEFKAIKKKLKAIAEGYKNKYNDEFGSFTTSASSGNPIKFNKAKLNRVWSGIFKGANNKQYAAQISFVVDEKNKALDIGFFFGRAASRGKSPDLNRLLYLGNGLSNAIKENPLFKQQYDNLIDFGFKSTTNQGEIDSELWLDHIQVNPQNSQLVYKLYANTNGIIEIETITLYVNMLMFLMTLIPSDENDIIITKKFYLTPEQRAKQTERKALIGLKGEEFILQQEILRLQKLNINHHKYLHHSSLISDHFGFDIQSCDDDYSVLYIEVKTTTRKKNNYKANEFHLSSNEYNFYLDNMSKYKLLRVYDIEGKPEFEEVDLGSATLYIDSYKIEI